MMFETKAEDFKRRVENNGPKIKNVPNVRTHDGVFAFSDYVAKDPGTWAYVPNKPDDVDVEAIAEEKLYEVFEPLQERFSGVRVEREEDEMYWANVTVEVPVDETARERLAEAVGDALLHRQQA